MVDDQCWSELAKLFELLPSITPSYAIAKGWNEHMQIFFKQGTEEEYFQFKPDSFRSDPLPSPTSTAASRPNSPPVRGSRSSSVTSPRSVPSSSADTSTTLQRDKPSTSDTFTFIPWKEPDSTPLKKRKARSSTVDKAIDSLEPVVNFESLCATLWESTPTFSSPSGPSSCYEILGRAINRLSGRVHVTGCHDRLFLLFVSHVVDEQEDDSRKVQDPSVYNHRSTAMERAAKLMTVEHQEVSYMMRRSNKYLRLLRNGASLLFDIKEGKKDLWERQLHLEDVDQVGNVARERWKTNRGKEFERNFLASKAIIDGLVRSGWTYSSLATANTHLMQRLREWIDAEELGRGKVQMRTIPNENGESHPEDQQDRQRNVDLGAREVRSIGNDSTRMVSGISPWTMSHVGASAHASKAGRHGCPDTGPNTRPQPIQYAVSTQSSRGFDVPNPTHARFSSYLPPTEQHSLQTQFEPRQAGLNPLVQEANFQFHNGSVQLLDPRGSNALYGSPASNVAANTQSQAAIERFDTRQEQTPSLAAPQHPGQHGVLERNPNWQPHDRASHVDAHDVQRLPQLPTFQFGQSTSGIHGSNAAHLGNAMSTIPTIRTAMWDPCWTIDLTNFTPMESAQALPEASLQPNGEPVW